MLSTSALIWIFRKSCDIIRTGPHSAVQGAEGLAVKGHPKVTASSGGGRARPQVCLTPGRCAASRREGEGGPAAGITFFPCLMAPPHPHPTPEFLPKVPSWSRQHLWEENPLPAQSYHPRHNHSFPGAFPVTYTSSPSVPTPVWPGLCSLALTSS